MANAFIANQTPSSIGGVLSLLVEMLVSAGWSFRGSGDGLSGYSPSGKIFTNSGAGALGWDNPSAWARLGDPSNKREFVFVRGSSNTTVRIKFSRAAKFVGGSPSATVNPTATDEKYIAGTSGSVSSAWITTGVTQRACVFYGMAQGDAPYGFWIAGGDAYRGWLRTALIVDPVKTISADPDPYVYSFSGCGASNNGVALKYNYFSPNFNDTTISTLNGGITNISAEFPYAIMDPAGVTYTPVAAASYYSSNLATIDNTTLNHAGGSYNPFDLNLDSFPIVYQRPLGPLISNAPTQYSGIKGWSTLCRWTNVPRVNWDTANNGTLICVGSFWLPWDGVTVPIGS